MEFQRKQKVNSSAIRNKNNRSTSSYDTEKNKNAGYRTQEKNKSNKFLIEEVVHHHNFQLKHINTGMIHSTRLSKPWDITVHHKLNDWLFQRICTYLTVAQTDTVVEKQELGRCFQTYL